MADARRETCLPHELEEALKALDAEPHRIRGVDWPGDLSETVVGQAGLYSWWVDSSGAADLAHGIGTAVPAGRIYAGQTGATKWPSGKTPSSTLLGRIKRNHLNGSIRSSTFRLTLAAALQHALHLISTGPSVLESTSEESLRAWMLQHLEVAVHPFAERDVLGDLEGRVLGLLDPPLNLDGMPDTPGRIDLRRLRQALRQGGLMDEK
jgi:hypothetical protein